jgi:pentatricopeptide repeat protein
LLNYKIQLTDSHFFLLVKIQVQLSKTGRADKPPIRVFNTVMNACEIVGEEDLTVRVLEALKETHETEGNLITFNIALKRLAKLGNEPACEGIIIGMLQNNVEPSVVSYTTAIAACVKEPKRPEKAAEWLKRMRSRRVQPNVLTYNTALAACLDGTLESTMRASQIATQMLVDIEAQVDGGIVDRDQYTDITPNLYTKSLGRQLMQQLKTKWESGEIDKAVAKTTLRTPFLTLSAFERSEIADGVIKQKKFIMDASKRDSEDLVSVTENDEAALEYEVAVSTHRVAAV